MSHNTRRSTARCARGRLHSVWLNSAEGRAKLGSAPAPGGGGGDEDPSAAPPMCTDTAPALPAACKMPCRDAANQACTSRDPCRAKLRVPAAWYAPSSWRKAPSRDVQPSAAEPAPDSSRTRPSARLIMPTMRGVMWLAMSGSMTSACRTSSAAAAMLLAGVSAADLSRNSLGESDHKCTSPTRGGTHEDSRNSTNSCAREGQSLAEPAMPPAGPDPGDSIKRTNAWPASCAAAGTTCTVPADVGMRVKPALPPPASMDVRPPTADTLGSMSGELACGPAANSASVVGYVNWVQDAALLSSCRAGSAKTRWRCTTKWVPCCRCTLHGSTCNAHSSIASMLPRRGTGWRCSAKCSVRAQRCMRFWHSCTAPSMGGVWAAGPPRAKLSCASAWFGSASGAGVGRRGSKCCATLWLHPCTTDRYSRAAADAASSALPLRSR